MSNNTDRPLNKDPEKVRMAQAFRKFLEHDYRCNKVARDEVYENNKHKLKDGLNLGGIIIKHIE